MSGHVGEHLAELLRASRDRDADAALGIWRAMSRVDQEEALLILAGLVEGETDMAADLMEASADEFHASIVQRVEERGAAGADATEPIPVPVDDLRGLTASLNNTSGLAAPIELPGNAYRSRWLQRWKWSVLIAAWAVTTTFAFTSDTSNFGPTEWGVALFTTVVLGGILVGTLINFPVAAITRRA